MDIAPPIVVAVDEDCIFFRSVIEAAREISGGAQVFDGLGRRLEVYDGALRISSIDPNGADDLAELLRHWLGQMDVLRESTANWSLSLLIQASVDHLGYARGRA